MQVNFSGLDLVYAGGGVHLPALGLWLDPTTRQSGPERVIVSHGHADHLGNHREVILTEPTAWFMHTRLHGKRMEVVMPFGEPREFTHGSVAYRVTLLPAGHVLGSAMILIEVKGLGLTVLYTGDFRLIPSPAAETCQPAPADLLIMETTFGRPAYRFPAMVDLRPRILEFMEQAFAAGAAPVLLGYSLGKCQELMLWLGELGNAWLLHEQAWKMTKIYEHFGYVFPAHAKFQAAPLPGHILLWPPQGRRNQTFPSRTAVFTGWATDPSCRFRYRTDAAFPLSDHADFPQLLEMVRRVKPRKVLTVHGFAADFAQTLRDHGCDAQSLSEPEQLGLPFVREDNIP
jgi:Cft2 family RNA processing exonuclease